MAFKLVNKVVVVEIAMKTRRFIAAEAAPVGLAVIVSIRVSSGLVMMIVARVKATVKELAIANAIGSYEVRGV